MKNRAQLLICPLLAAIVAITLFVGETRETSERSTEQPAPGGARRPIASVPLTLTTMTMKSVHPAVAKEAQVGTDNSTFYYISELRADRWTAAVRGF